MAMKFPQKFGSYILLRKIAMGGMAEIFRGKTVGAEGFEKDLVIKRILPHYTEDEDFVKMFIDEASIAAKLQHSNIVQIFDFNSVDGCYYIAMEYVEGNDLKNLIDASHKQEKLLTPAQCVWIVMEISKGLHHAHIKSYKGKPLNIVHRDISPQNAMISFNGEIKLMDFGIAKAASRSTKTVAGTVKGKCAYMSPEQARGKPLDGRSDLFGLAVVLWEMLTHKRLFLGNSDFVTLSNVLKQDAPAPSSINPDVPEELDAIVLKALAKDREERQPTVEQFARDLTKWFYATVDDLDSVALGPVMKDLFAEDLDQLSKWSQQENEMLAQAHNEASNSKEVQAVSNEDATVAVAAADFDPQDAKTLMEGSLSADQVKQAIAAQQANAGEATVALSVDVSAVPNTATGKAALAGTGTHASSGGSKLWIIIALLLLVGAGVAAVVLTGGDKKGSDNASDKTVAEESTSKGNQGNDRADDDKNIVVPPPIEEVKVQFQLTPEDAILLGEGITQNAAGDYTFKGKPGSKLVVTIQDKADPTKKRPVEVTVQEGGGLFPIKLAEPKPATLRIKPDPADATVFANNKSVKKDVNGFYIVKAMEGDSVEIFIKNKAGKESKSKSLTLKAGSQTSELSLGPPAATLRVACQPGDATVRILSGQGTVTAAKDHSLIAGDDLIKGKSLKVECKKDGYIRKVSRSISLAAGENKITLKMNKVGETPVGVGTLIVNSLPYGKCTVRGVTKGVRATFKGVPAGKTRVTCKTSKGKRTKTARVKANGTTTLLFKPDDYN
jgi:serine/threonine protein kinase